MTRIKINIGEFEFNAKLLETPTAKAICAKLPISGQAQIWGDEIYFSVPVNADLEKDSREVVAVGDLAFWPLGSAFCIFFGKTPASIGNEPRAASAVNVFGKLEGNIEKLKKVKSQSKIQVRKITN